MFNSNSSNTNQLNDWENNPHFSKARALFEKGRSFEHGLNGNPSPEKAAHCYRMAAMRGYAPAQNALGFCYITGFGVSPDDRLAESWFKSAARLGYEPAQINYGALCIDGKGEGANPQEGLEYLCNVIVSASKNGSHEWMNEELLGWLAPMVNS